MRYRNIPKLGIKVSAFGLGCMRFPMKTTEDGKTEVDYPLAESIIHRAVDGGVNYLDTAFVYSNGQNEDVVGRALQGGYREKVYLATKLPTWQCEKTQDMYDLFEKQLKALRTDHIDFYLIHSLSADKWDKMKEIGVREFLDELKAKKLIRYACFSFHDSYEAFEHILNDYDWDMCQIQFNILDVNNQAGLKGLKLAGSKNIPVVIMEGLLGGKLASVPDTVQAVYDSYSEKRSAAEWAFRWLCNFDEVATVLSGVTDINMTEDNLRIFDRVYAGCMSDEELQIIDKAREEYQKRLKIGCTGCRYCMPCPQGVDIPGIFSIWNDSYKFNRQEEGKHRYASLSEANRASMCVGCGACQSVCPQNLSIPEKLREAETELS